MKPLKDFEIKREAKGAVQILRLVGQLDDMNSHRLRGVFQALNQADQHRIVIDCENVDYISCAAMRSLLDFTKAAREAKGDLILVKVPPKVKDIIDVIGAGDVVKTSDSEKLAIKQLTPPEEPGDAKK